METSLLANCHYYLSRPARGRGPGNCGRLVAAGCEVGPDGKPTEQSVRELLHREQQSAGYLWFADSIRTANGGRTDLPHTNKIGIAIVAVPMRVVAFWNNNRNRRYRAVAYTAIGHSAAPGAYFGEFTTEEKAANAARKYMLANGWVESWAAAVADGTAKLRRDHRYVAENEVEV